MTIHIFTDPASGTKLPIDLENTPAEKGGGVPGNAYCGTRVSFSYFPLTQVGQWEEIPLNNVERIEKQNSAVPFTIKDSGFYVVGADIEITSDSINDFALAFRVLQDDGTEVLRKYTRILSKGEKQEDTKFDYQYLQQGTVLTLEATHGIGENVLDYAALWVFRADEPDELPKSAYIKSYWGMEEVSGARSDETAAAPLAAKNSPLQTSGIIGNAVAFDASNFDALFTNLIDPVSYEDGFTISGWIRIPVPSSSYSVLAARWIGDNTTTEDQFLLFHDHFTNTFKFTFRETTGIYRVLTTFDSYTQTNYNHLAITYDKISGYVRLYLNGRIQDSIKTDGFSTTTTQPFSVGAYNITADNPLEHSTCSVDELFLCCRSYISDEIATLFNDGNALSFDDIADDDANQGEGGGGPGNGITLPIDGTDVNFDNSSANLPGAPGNVQTAIEALDSVVDSIVASTIFTYQQSILFMNWTLDNVEGAYRYDIPFTSHGLANPSVFNVERTDNGFNFNDASCEIRVNNISKDISIFVNDIPDVRFSGRISVIGF